MDTCGHLYGHQKNSQSKTSAAFSAGKFPQQFFHKRAPSPKLPGDTALVQGMIAQNILGKGSTMKDIPRIPDEVARERWPDGFKLRDEANVIVAYALRNGPIGIFMLESLQNSWRTRVSAGSRMGK